MNFTNFFSRKVQISVLNIIGSLPQIGNQPYRTKDLTLRLAGLDIAHAGGWSL